MKHSLLIFLFFMSIVGSVSSCDTNNDNPNTSKENNDNNTMMGSKIKIRIGSRIFTATLYDNATATAFKAQLPIRGTCLRLILLHTKVRTGASIPAPFIRWATLAIT